MTADKMAHMKVNKHLEIISAAYILPTLLVGEFAASEHAGKSLTPFGIIARCSNVKLYERYGYQTT